MANAVDDSELMDRWQGGDGRAGEVLVERYFDQLYNFFQTKLDTDADELVQLTFLACLDAKERFRREASFRTFLYAIAKNQLYAFVRKRSTRADRHIELEASSIVDLVSTPRTKIARNQDYELLLGCLRRLPVEQQTLLELHYWSDLGMADLAAIFEAPEVTIRSRLHRARNALRDLLAAGSVPAGASIEATDEWARTLSQVRG